MHTAEQVSVFNLLLIFELPWIRKSQEWLVGHPFNWSDLAGFGVVLEPIILVVAKEAWSWSQWLGQWLPDSQALKWDSRQASSRSLCWESFQSPGLQLLQQRGEHWIQSLAPEILSGFCYLQIEPRSLSKFPWDGICRQDVSQVAILTLLNNARVSLH